MLHRQFHVTRSQQNGFKLFSIANEVMFVFRQLPPTDSFCLRYRLHASQILTSFESAPHYLCILRVRTKIVQFGGKKSHIFRKMSHLLFLSISKLLHSWHGMPSPMHKMQDLSSTCLIQTVWSCFAFFPCSMGFLVNLSFGFQPLSRGNDKFSMDHVLINTNPVCSSAL